MRSRPAYIHPSNTPPKDAEVVTPAELAALKAAGTLDVNKIYEVSTGAATGGVVYVYPASASEVSHEADYFDAAISNETLKAEYDCDTDRIHRMYDTNREVIVTGQAEVDAFPWGEDDITESTFHNTNFNYTAGEIRQLHIEESTLTVDGDVIRVNIQGLSNVVVSNGARLADSIVDSDSTVTVSGGTTDHTTFSGNTLFNSNGVVTNSNFTSGARVTNTGGGTINEVTGSDNCNIRFTGTGSIVQSEITANGLLYADTFAGVFRYNTVSNASTVTLAGSAGNIERNTFDSYARATLTNVNVNFVYNNLTTASVNLAGSTGLSFTNNTIAGEGTVIIRNATAGTFRWNSVLSRGYVSATGYTGGIQYTNITSNGQLNNINNFSGLISQTNVSNRARLILTDSAMTIRYSNFTSYAHVYAERSLGAVSIEYSSVHRGYLYLRDAINIRFNSNLVSGLSYVYMNTANGGYIHQSEFSSYSRTYAEGLTQTARYLAVSGDSRLNIRALSGLLQRTELHSYARITYAAGGSGSNNNYNNISLTIAAATSNDVQGY